VRVWSRNTPRATIASLSNLGKEAGQMDHIVSAVGRAFRKLRRLGGEVGQGTVEYVALILLVALVMAGVVTAMKGYKTDQGKSLGDAVITKIKSAVDSVQF
jgi:hypothetical protein